MVLVLGSIAAGMIVAGKVGCAVGGGMVITKSTMQGIGYLSNNDYRKALRSFKAAQKTCGGVPSDFSSASR